MCGGGGGGPRKLLRMIASRAPNANQASALGGLGTVSLQERVSKNWAETSIFSQAKTPTDRCSA